MTRVKRKSDLGDLVHWHGAQTFCYNATEELAEQGRWVKVVNLVQARALLGRWELVKQFLLRGETEAARMEMLRLTWDMTGPAEIDRKPPTSGDFRQTG